MTAHPAKFSARILDVIADITLRHLPPRARILDPFAGVGGIHYLDPPFQTWGVEIEAEWAYCHPMTVVGDSRFLPAIFPSVTFDAIVTSPCYGNRMADHHEARDESKRHTYRHYLGRPLTGGSAGGLQWGEEYRVLHREVYASCAKVLSPGGLFVLNMSDHIRKKKRVRVTQWHVHALRDLGFRIVEIHRVETPRQKHGQNGEARVPYETVVALRSPA